MEKIVILCVLKSGGDYDFNYVVRLRNMIKRNTTIPYRFICLTDVSMHPAICETIKLTDNLPGWWSKIELFKPNLVECDRIVFFDLDTVIVGNIDQLLLQRHDFVALGSFVKGIVRNPFGSGMMSWKNNNEYSFLYNNFSIILLSKIRGGDQTYFYAGLQEQNKKVSFWQNIVEGVYSYKWHCLKGLPKNAKVICFHGKPRPIDVQTEWVKQAWQ